MDELTLLRKVREPEAVSEEALSRGRAALFGRMTATAPRRSHRGMKIAGLGALAAGALTAALVLTNVVGLAGWRGGAEPAAAEVLHSAALAAVESSDPVLGQGQYLLVATSSVHSATIQTRDGENAAYLFSSEDELYIPADREDDWVWSRHAPSVYQTFGPASAAAAATAEPPHPGETDELLQAPGGAFYGGEAGGGYGDLADLPRDPVQLLNHIYRVTLGAGPSPDGEALVYIADRLRTGVVPADLRAAFYEAAALIPGVTITEEQATLDGRTGIAIGRDEGSSFRQEIIIDPDTGLFIGEREITLTGLLDIPAGTAVSWSAVTTSVTDSAPQGGTVNGIFDVMGCISDGKGNAQCPTD